MAEVEEELVFHTAADQLVFLTKTNGDSLRINDLKLTQTQATSMAWLVNANNAGELEINIKVKP